MEDTMSVDIKPVELRKVKRQVQAKKRREQNQNTKGTFNA